MTLDNKHGREVGDRSLLGRDFYAAEDARVYDHTIRFLAPTYDQLHDVIAQVVRATLCSKDDGIINILDIGCGTGEEALRIAAQLPNASVVALDKSSEMLGVFRNKLQGSESGSLASRIRLVRADIASDEWSAERLCSLIVPRVGGERYDAIVSALVLHHFTADTLSKLYSRFYEALTPGGVFVNGDLFDLWSPELSSLALKLGVDYINTQLDRVEAREAVEKLGSCVKDLRDRWVAHMHEENIPLPIEHRCKETGFATGICNSDLLVKSGFTEIECPFRYWQAGVLWARR